MQKGSTAGKGFLQYRWCPDCERCKDKVPSVLVCTSNETNVFFQPKDLADSELRTGAKNTWSMDQEDDPLQRLRILGGSGNKRIF